MSSPPADVQVALSILQIVGLLIPVIFVALRPYFESAVGQDSGGLRNRKEDVEFSDGSMTIDRTPAAMKLGLAAIVLLASSAIFAGWRVLLWASNSLIVSVSVLTMGLGILCLVVLIFILRLEFVSEIPGV